MRDGATLWVRNALLSLVVMFSVTAFAGEGLAEFERTAMEISAGLSARDVQAFNRALDADTVIATALDPLILDPEFKRGFVGPLKGVIESQLAIKIVDGIPEGGYARTLRVKREGGLVKALLRADFGDNGTAYMDLHLKKDDDGMVRIVDWFDYSSGQLYTESLGQIANISSPTPTIIGKIFDRVTDNKKNRDAIMELFGANKQGEHATAVKLFLEMNEDLLKNRVLNIFAIQAAMQSGDDDLYMKTLQVLDKYHGSDPTLTFMLLDYHFMNSNFNKVVSSLHYLEKTFGVEDAAIQSMIANVHIQSGETAAAVKSALHAIELEPEYEDGYWSLMTAQLQGKEFAGAVATAKMLEGNFGYDMGPDSLGSNETYKELLQSKEYSSWRAGG